MDTEMLKKKKNQMRAMNIFQNNIRMRCNNVFFWLLLIEEKGNQETVRIFNSVFHPPVPSPPILAVLILVEDNYSRLGKAFRNSLLICLLLGNILEATDEGYLRGFL